MFNESCCDSSIVTGGTFLRGYDAATDFFYSDMSRPATISSFRLDRYEITVGRFRAFVAAGQGTQQSPPAAGAGGRPTIPGSGWDPAWNNALALSTASLIGGLQCDPTYQTWTDSPGAGETRPISCITWVEAVAFCAWDGGFLPTENEWNYAASGGDQHRAYPWSSPPGDLTIDCSTANSGSPVVCVPLGANTVGATSPAGDGVFGQADLAGNVWEWNLDWFSGYASPCNDCANLITGTDRMIHGGSARDPTGNLRTANRAHILPTSRLNNVGARCARSI